MTKPDPRIRIALVQMSMAEDPATNVETAASFVRSAAEEGANLVCLPELFRTRYFCQSQDADRFDLAEPIPGPTTDEFASLARELRITLLAPIFERRAPGVYHNSVVVLGEDGSLRGHYRKMHVPNDPCFEEKFYFTPGDLGFPSFDIGPCRIAVPICWDQWFPEAARLATLRGAQILFYPTAIGWLDEEREHEGDLQLDAW